MWGGRCGHGCERVDAGDIRSSEPAIFGAGARVVDRAEPPDRLDMCADHIFIGVSEPMPFGVFMVVQLPLGTILKEAGS